MLKLSEFEIQRATVIWLDGQPANPATGRPARPGALRPGVVYWHTPNGGLRDGLEAKRFREMGVKAGIPDLFFLWGGLYALEFKQPGGRLSPVQISMAARLRAANVAAWDCVDNLADAKAFCIKHGLAVDSKLTL